MYKVTKRNYIGPSHIKKLWILIGQLRGVRTPRIHFHFLRLKSQKATISSPKQPFGRPVWDIVTGN